MPAEIGLMKGNMMHEEVIEALTDKDNQKGYAVWKQICAESAESDAYYELLDSFLAMLTHESAYVRTRGFVLACAQARWDTQGKLETAFDKMRVLLHDPKPTVVRQCLGALHEVARYRPELRGKIKEAVAAIELSRYRDSMAPLIQKDADALMGALLMLMTR